MDGPLKVNGRPRKLDGHLYESERSMICIGSKLKHRFKMDGATKISTPEHGGR